MQPCNNSYFVNMTDSVDEGHTTSSRLEKLEDVYAPKLSSSAPELQGEWTEVKKRTKEKREKKKDKVC